MVRDRLTVQFSEIQGYPGQWVTRGPSRNSEWRHSRFHPQSPGNAGCGKISAV